MIAVDPGVNACGVADFSDTGFLMWARYLPIAELHPFLSLRSSSLKMVIEMPRIYPGSGQKKGDLNDLLNLAAVVGYCEGLFLNPAKRVYRVFPAEWKGQVPKKIMTQRILDTLSVYERENINRIGAKDHNTIDAVGIGLHYFKRL